MAIMHPNYVYQFNSLSEKKMFESLKRQLSNDYEVFYSVVWYSKDDSGERINSESDFVIVDRNKINIQIDKIYSESDLNNYIKDMKNIGITYEQSIQYLQELGKFKK